MLSYLHGFHAGNLADIQKHAAQVLALRMMQAKPSGIACFDTHAGSALYDLRSERARKTAEADAGVGRLWALRDRLQTDDWAPLIDVLADLNGDVDELRRYPGSPEWFRRLQRDQDSLTVFELHPAEGEQLAAWGGRGTTRVFREDGLRGLLRQLPPRLPRLMVLIDPSYEVKSEYRDVADTLARAWRKCRHGVYLVWYPLLTSGLEQALKDAVKSGPVSAVLCSEIRLERPPERGMVGSGLLVVNPPWGFGDRLEKLLADVSGADGLSVSSAMSWLVPE
ncbi:23S rRNA (adenine(2030)-N(6))-methyltransferase RlmJ [Marinobacter lipolyticus]|uniref:23S rRNA (adenine(2030)-N(6))-methyltransferase RlmJ n=1 Tax=Marinobacter lipolyticus TaxID=209639 RepID=UPI001BCDBE5F|nr:23S rRNA (adenine(2030)-N(6))-methyltransferase RlmJ [Marinobacter lipolyticus]MBS8240568.1 23S rRNA (adenine(2030)-N(6))-methyltransferase RlmJ [Marinobacter lipolyticus]